MNVAQETLGFRRAGLSPALSLLMSAFALPIPPAVVTHHLHRPTERSPTIQEPEFRGQKSETAHLPLFPTSDHALQHLGDLLVFIAPTLPRRLVDVAQVETESAPNPHLIAPTHAYLYKAFEFGYRVALLGIAFCQIDTDGLARAAHLLGQRVLLHHRKFECGSMHFQRQSIRSLKDFEVLNPLMSICHLSSEF